MLGVGATILDLMMILVDVYSVVDNPAFNVCPHVRTAPQILVQILSKAHTLRLQHKKALRACAGYGTATHKRSHDIHSFSVSTTLYTGH